MKNKDRERKEIRWKNFMIPISTWISWNFVTKLYKYICSNTRGDGVRKTC